MEEFLEPNLPEFKRLLDKSLRHMEGFLGVPAQGEKLALWVSFNSGYSMILYVT